MTSGTKTQILHEIKESIKSDRKYYDGDHYATYHIIYNDGSQVVANDEDIASGLKVSLTNISYARKEDGDGEQDTKSGYNFMAGWTGEQKEAYYQSLCND